MKNYRIFKVSLEAHRESIIELKRANLKFVTEDEYAWKYENSPIGIADCWFAQELGKGSFVGACALFPRFLSCDNKRIMAAVAGDFSVNKEHRIAGPAILMQREMISSVESCGRTNIIYGIPNKMAIPIFKRIGFQRLGSYCRYLKVLSVSYLNGRGLAGADLIRNGLDGLLKYISRETYLPIPGGIEIERVIKFDERFDVLWEKASKQFVIAGERSSGYLNWRFLGHPKRKCDVFAIVGDGGRKVLGYVVYQLLNDVCYIVDVLFLDEKCIDILMSSFLRSMRDERAGAVVLSCMGSAPLLRCLKRFHFFIRSNSFRDVMIYISKDVLERDWILDERNWYFMKGDTDSDLVSNVDE